MSCSLEATNNIVSCESPFALNNSDKRAQKKRHTSTKKSDISSNKADLDAGGGRGAQPVAVGREDERVDDVPGVERVEALALLKVPQHGGAVLAPGGAQRPVRRHGHGVQVPGPIKPSQNRGEPKRGTRAGACTPGQTRSKKGLTAHFRVDVHTWAGNSRHAAVRKNANLFMD